ncbi:MAG: DUF4153 domain-containing protein [Pyrinomonadaceae bacterium]
MMSKKSRIGIYIALAGACLGVLGDYLIHGVPFGLGTFAWFVLLTFSIVSIKYRNGLWKDYSNEIALLCALLFFASTFVWRDAVPLTLLNIFAILVILITITIRAFGINPWFAGTIHYIVAAISNAVNFVFAPVMLLFMDIDWKGITGKQAPSQFAAILKGFAVLIPVGFILAMLLISADSTFAAFVNGIVTVKLSNIIYHVVTIGFFTWLTTGYLRTVGFGFPWLQPNMKLASATDYNPIFPVEKYDRAHAGVANISEKTRKSTFTNFDNSILPRSLTLGSVEISIILGGINLLFLTFVIFQIPYLFGGLELVQKTPDFKLSEYARHGFGELILVAAIVLPLLLISEWLLRKNDKANALVFKILAIVQIALLGVILVSAAQRLILLSGPLGYGFTSARLYPLFFILFLGATFAWFTISVLRNARNQFAWGTLWCGLFVLLLLNTLNPDEFIAKKNIDLMLQGRPFDADLYSGDGGSADSIPVLLEALPKMSPADGERIISIFERQKCQIQRNYGIRQFNFSREKAYKLIKQNIDSNTVCDDSM